jgi:hypothetical protein
VRIATSSAEGKVRLEISDSGCGMTDEVRSRIFEPFFTTKAPGQGVGLGLSTVFAVVEDCGGRIDVASEPGVGTRVWIDLPAAEVDIHARPAPRAERTFGAPTILVVEDEEDLREVLQAFLTAAGYQVMTAPDGLQALVVLRDAKERIELLLSDVVMPGMSGRDLAKKVHEEWPTRRDPRTLRLRRGGRRLLYQAVRHGRARPTHRHVGWPPPSVEQMSCGSGTRAALVSSDPRHGRARSHDGDAAGLSLQLRGHRGTARL